MDGDFHLGALPVRGLGVRMKTRDRILTEGAAAALAVAARRGPEALEAALGRMTTRQLARVGDDYIEQLRRGTDRTVGKLGRCT